MHHNAFQRKLSDFLFALFLSVFVGSIIGAAIGHFFVIAGWVAGVMATVALFLRFRNDFSKVCTDSTHEEGQ